MAEGARLAGELSVLGVTRGATLLVHASLGGTGLRARTLRDALLAVLGEEGTLVVPAFTPENSTTSAAHLRQVEGLGASRKADFLAAMPAFDPARTPCPGMGRLAECVRLSEGAVRSDHPQTSFAAVGARARELVKGHPADCHLGEESPLGKLFEADAQELMINVGFEVCTSFHLAEYRIPDTPPKTYRCVVNAGGKRAWFTYEDIALDDSDFELIGADFPRTGLREGKLGNAAAMLFPIKDAVGHAVKWMTEKRR
ncbi:AAC(3) family N-acetyltransferase [Streptomyces sp. NBC_01267]|uniref:aminoglycoside N(3)-acetyltransferase n=1 Tax=unclassified Streptomyces TaxID=2593676 RepID=UPI002256B0F9|nr:MULTISPECIES: AAC(3) family N-acetyltransferase [unclassified Streptomyces]MCX4551983.1 AAC(3) family N-acetyltransferase [Streptomyces sp. NBC_01500]WSV57248.1 AAC(3) family N-acetyltransferase [Streptomyces sp. NBC_01014]